MATEVGALRAASTGTWGVFRGELGRWLGRRGLFHLVLWLVVVEWALYVNVATKNQPFGYIGFESLMNILTIFPIVAGIVLTAVSVCGSYHDGTTGWVLGKPVPRGGYLTASVGAIWLGLTVTAIVIPGLVARWWLPNVEPYRFVPPDAPALSRFAIALGLLSLVLAFFMSLTALLSVAIRRRGVEKVRVKSQLSPAWTTAWITDAAREKLKQYGIAPPLDGETCAGAMKAAGEVACPHCGSTATEEISRFGSTPCKASWRCTSCLEPFDYFKSF